MKQNDNKKMAKITKKLLILLLVNILVIFGVFLNSNYSTFSDGIKDFLAHRSDSLGLNARNNTAEMAHKGGNAVPIRSSEHSVNTTHLEDVFFKLEINHKEVDPENPVIIHEGEMFDLGFIFKETLAFQYVDDDTPMMYVLPEGFVIPDFQTDHVDITVNNLGTNVTVYGNEVTYNSEERTFYVVFNKEDPNFPVLTASEDATFRIKARGSVEIPDSGRMDLGNGFVIVLSPPHDAGVTKEAVYDPVLKKVIYHVYVLADGDIDAEHPIYISDTVVGSALTVTPDSMTVESNVGEREVPVTFAVNDDLKGFTAQIDGMVDLEVITFTYTADVDFTKLSVSGTNLVDEVGNNVTLTHPGNIYDDLNNNYDEENPPIVFSDIIKSHTITDQYFEDGSDNVYRDLAFTIETNKTADASLAGTDIVDTMEYNKDVISALRYNGDGIHVEKYEKDGFEDDGITQKWRLADTEDVTWEDLGISKPSSTHPCDKPWTYHIPETDGEYWYVITYTMQANLKEMQRSDEFDNTVSGKGGVYTDHGVVGPVGGQTIPIRKSLISSNAEYSTWKIAIDIRPEGYDNGFELTETLPYKWMKKNPSDSYNTLFKDDLVSWELVSTPVEGEIVEQKAYIDDNPDAVNRLIIAFYKPDGEGGTVPGAVGTGEERTVEFKIVTQNSVDWLDNVVEGTYASPWYREHRNRGSIRADNNLFNTDSATASPMRKTLKKYENTSRSLSARTITIDGVSYVMHEFRVTLTGIEELSFDVMDIFDKELFKLFDQTILPGNWHSNPVMYG